LLGIHEGTNQGNPDFNKMGEEVSVSSCNKWWVYSLQCMLVIPLEIVSRYPPCTKCAAMKLVTCH